MFREVLNKRGQEGMTLGTLLLIILGVVVLVVLIIGFTTGFGFIFNIFDAAPGQQLEAVVQGCVLAANNNLVTDYCRQFREVSVDGQKQFVLCQSDIVQQAISARDENVDDINCGAFVGAVNDFCRNSDELRSRDWNSVLVNGTTCEEVTGVGFDERRNGETE